MGVIMLNGIAYGGDNFFRLTQAEYDALTPYEQTHGNYCITDAGATGDLASNYVTYTSGDSADADATSWTSVQPMANTDIFSTLFNKISTMAKNVRYLKNLLNDNVWQDVTSEFTPMSSGMTRYFVMYNKFTKEIRIKATASSVANATAWLTIPQKYQPDTSLMYTSGNTSYPNGMCVGRYTQNPSSTSQIYAFMGTIIYDASTSQIKINFPITGSAYGVSADIYYCVA